MASQQDVARETNARFWIMTQYKIGEALDPADPTDQRLAKIWLDIYQDLLRQNALGALTLTHRHPSFAQSLDNLISVARIERTTTREDDPRHAEARRVKHQALNDAGLWYKMAMSSPTSAVTGAYGPSWRWRRRRWPASAVTGAYGPSWRWRRRRW